MFVEIADLIGLVEKLWKFFMELLEKGATKDEFFKKMITLLRDHMREVVKSNLTPITKPIDFAKTKMWKYFTKDHYKEKIEDVSKNYLTLFKNKREYVEHRAKTFLISQLGIKNVFATPELKEKLRKIKGKNPLHNTNKNKKITRKNTFWYIKKWKPFNNLWNAFDDYLKKTNKIPSNIKNTWLSVQSEWISEIRFRPSNVPQTSQGFIDYRLKGDPKTYLGTLLKPNALFINMLNSILGARVYDLDGKHYDNGGAGNKVWRYVKGGNGLPNHPLF